MQDVVSVCTRITFGNDSDVFTLPLPLLINPDEIYDREVYRVSIGTTEEITEEYQKLINELDKRMPFIENMHILVDGAELIFKLAYMTKSIKPFGVFYDIEATEDDLIYRKELT